MQTRFARTSQGKLEFDEKGKLIEWTFEDWLRKEHEMNDRYGQRLMRGVEFIRKLTSPEANKNTEIVRLKAPVLPSNEGQIRPLLTALQHDGERIHVWAEVANSGEKKITAELVQALRHSSRCSCLASTAPRKGQDVAL